MTLIKAAAILAAVATCALGQVELGDTIKPAGSFPSHQSQYGKGGLIEFDTYAAMTNLAANQRIYGMVGSVTGALYILQADLTTWTEFDSGGDGTTNASGIWVSFTPTNYVPATNNVEASLSAIDGAFNSFVGTGTLSTLVYTNDARLTDARTPTAHNQGWETITNVPASITNVIPAWTNMDFTGSDITSITSRAHADLTGIGSNAHSVLDAHVDSDALVHAGATNLVHTIGAEDVYGVKTFKSFPVTPSEIPTDDYQVANKVYVDTLAAGLQWRDPVLDKDLTNAPTGTNGNRYIVGVGSIGDWSGNDNEIATYSTAITNWTFEVPTTGWAVVTLDDNTGWTYSSESNWVQFAGIIPYSGSLGVKLVADDFQADLVSNGGIELDGNSMYVNVDNVTLTNEAGTLKVLSGIDTNESYTFANGTTQSVDTATIRNGVWIQGTFITNTIDISDGGHLQWWKNAPTSAVEVATNTPSSGQVLATYDGTNLAWITVTTVEMLWINASNTVVYTNSSSYTNILAHPSLTTSVHGITNTADLVYVSDYRLTNARSPTAHTQAWSTVSGTPTTASGYGLTDVVLTNDTRLTNARSPTAHTQLSSTITDLGSQLWSTNQIPMLRLSSHISDEGTLAYSNTLAWTKVDGLGTAATNAQGAFLAFDGTATNSAQLNGMSAAYYLLDENSTTSTNFNTNGLGKTWLSGNLNGTNGVYVQIGTNKWWVLLE